MNNEARFVLEGEPLWTPIPRHEVRAGSLIVRTDYSVDEDVLVLTLRPPSKPRPKMVPSDVPGVLL